jgi:hypothetical protein
MFLNSGEGIVFKGAFGPWYSEPDHSFHLSHEKSAELMRMVIACYEEMHSRLPTELFIHGKTWLRSTSGKASNPRCRPRPSWWVSGFDARTS